MNNQSKHQAFNKGIFVQRNLSNKYSTTYCKPFCVTFPRLANLSGDPKDDNIAMFPSDDFSTFNQALSFALQVKKIDSRLKNCPVFLLDFKWINSRADRLLQRIG